MQVLLWEGRGVHSYKLSVLLVQGKASKNGKNNLTSSEQRRER